MLAGIETQHSRTILVWETLWVTMGINIPNWNRSEILCCCQELLFSTVNSPSGTRSRVERVSCSLSNFGKGEFCGEPLKRTAAEIDLLRVGTIAVKFGLKLYQTRTELLMPSPKYKVSRCPLLLIYEPSSHIHNFLYLKLKNIK